MVACRSEGHRKPLALPQINNDHNRYENHVQMSFGSYTRLPVAFPAALVEPRRLEPAANVSDGIRTRVTALTGATQVASRPGGRRPIALQSWS
jgi:hypothetical protein